MTERTSRRGFGRGTGESTRSARWVVPLALLAALAVAWQAGRVGPVGTVAPFALVGLAVQHDAIERLTGEIRRFREGEAVDFDAPDGELAALYEAVGDLAADARQGADWRRLHAVATDEASSDDEAVERLLSLARDRAGLERALVVRVDGEARTVTDAVGCAPDEATVPADAVERTVDAGEAVVVADPDEAGCVVGAPLRTDGDVVGVVCLVGPDACPEFSERTLSFLTEASASVARVVERRDERAARERAESLVDTMFEDLPAHLFLKDRAGRHVRVSRLTGEKFGEFKRSGVIGKTDLEVLPEETAEETYADDLRVIEEGEPVVDKPERHGDDWYLTSKVPWRDSDGEVQGLVGFARDVTDRRERERQLSAIVENTTDVIYIKDRDGVYQFANRALAEEAELDPEQVVGKTDEELFEPDSVAAIREGDQRVLETGETVTCEVRLTIDGEERVFSDEKHPYRDEDGEIVGVMGISTDVTDRRERERELERQASLLDSLFEQLPVSLYVKDEQARHVRTSTPHRSNKFSEDEEWFRGKTDADIYPSELAEETYADDLRVIEEGESIIDKEEYNPEMDEWLLTSKVPWRGEDGAVRGLIGISQYITDQKERQREVRETRDRLEESNRTLRRLYEISADREAGFEEKVRQVLELGQERLGADAGFLATVDPESDGFRVEHAVGTDDRVRAGATASLSETYCRKALDASGLVAVADAPEEGWADDPAYERWGYDCYVGHTVTVAGEPYGTVSFVGADPCESGVTEEQRTFVELAAQWLEYELERQRREDRLERYREYTDDVLGAIDDVFYVLDEQGEPRRWNDSLTDVLGLSDADIGGMTVTDAFGPADAERVRDAIREVLRTGRTRLEADLVTADGEAVPYEFSAVTLEDPEGDTVVAGIGRDVSERQARERELERTTGMLEQSQRLARVGAWEVDIEDGDAVDITWTDEVYRIHDLPVGTDVSVEQSLEFYHPEDRPEVDHAIARANREGRPYEFEVRLVTPEDETKWVRSIGNPIVEDGEVVQVRGSIQDVTERKEAERALMEREQRLERYREYTDDILDAIDDVFYVVDQDLSLQRWNRSLESVTGYDAEEVAELHPSELVVEEDVDDTAAAIEEVFETGTARLETRVRTKDGAAIPYEFSAVSLENPDGDPVLVGIGRDVSKRRKRERQLRRTTERMQRFIETSPVGVLATDPEGVVTLWNDAMTEIFGWSAEEVVGEPYPAVPEDADQGESVRERVLSGEPVSQVEVERVTKAGERIDVMLSTNPIYDESGELTELVAYVQDISERKERERALRENKNQLRALVDVLPVAVFVAEADGEIVEWNEAAEEVWGGEVFESESVAEYEAYDGWWADTGERLQPDEWALARALDGEEVTDPDEIEIEGFDGKRRTVLNQGMPVRDADGEMSRAVVTVVDISERKERERQLAARSAAMEGAIDGMAILDADGEYTYVNRAHADVYGYDDPDAFVGESWEMCYDEAETERLQREALPALSERGQWRGETAGRRADGTTFPQELSLSMLPDGRMVCVVRDVTDRKERERELQRTTEMLEQAQRVAGVGGWELDLRADPPEMTWTDELYRLHGADPETDLDLDTILEFYHPEDRQRIRRLFDHAATTSEGYDMEVRLQTGDQSRWVRAIGEPVRAGGEGRGPSGDRAESGDGAVVRIHGSIQDITEQKERERALRSLHDTTRGLVGAESEPAVADIVVDAAADILEAGGVALYLLDDASNRLEPVDYTDGFADLTDGVPSVGAGDTESLLWNCFVTGTPTAFDDSDASARSLFGADVGGGLLFPLGDHGVFVVATGGTTVPDRTRQLAETLVATTEAALDRLASAATLRERDAELEARNRRLERQVQVTDIIRGIDRSLIQASSREEVESAVCRQLAEAEHIAFAWIGGVDSAGDRVVPRAWAGAGDDYLDAVALSTAGDSLEPAAATARGEQPTVVGNVVEDLQRDPWRTEALAADFHSVLSVPLTYEGYFYGTLTVYADEPGLFDELERTVFAELGTNIANSINAVETRRALHADTLVELSLELDGGETFLGRVAGTADCTVEYEGLATDAEDESRLFFAAVGADEGAVEAVLEEMVSVQGYRLVDEAEDRRLYEVTVAGDVLPVRLVHHGASPRSISVADGRTSLVVDIPTTTDVREFVEMLRELAPSVELVGRRTVERATQTRQELVSTLFDGLTDRQLEVLRTAYFAGFFEWPRTSTGEDVAEMLGVTQPTVNRHLRLAQQRLLEQLLEEGAPAAAAD